MSYDPHDATVEEAIDYVRATITPMDVVDLTDDVMVFNGKIFSPFNPDERTPSCHLYEDGWFDFSSGKGGDVIDLYRALTGATFGQALHQLQKGSFRIEADPDRVRRHTPLVPDLTHQFEYHVALANSTIPIRNWFPHVADAPLCEYLGRRVRYTYDPVQMAIPHWHPGENGDLRVRGIKLRTSSGQKSAVPGSSFACGLYWPSPIHGGADNRTLVITEGESDAWTLDMHYAVTGGVDVAALPAGAGLWKDSWLAALEQYETIYTAFDNDRAGQNATEKVRLAIGWGRWKELAVPTLYNDVREAYRAGWRPGGL
jgi:Toprim-like